MAILKNKTELIDDIKFTYQKLQIELTSIPEKLTKSKDLEGHAKGTKMSVCNLVAYLIGWGNLVLKWYKIKKQGKEPDFPETGYKWNELGKLAQKFYADYQHDDFQTLLKKCDKVVKDILKLIEEKDNTSLYESLWYGKYTMGRMIQFNTSSPYKNAYTRIRKWKKEKGIK
ncbi:MAG: ClbS/DfsB family four-helix bundle protein [Flavobacteriaceae bacterium]